jgi:RimJ/RimL family protein N-acetyltransferase
LCAEWIEKGCHAYWIEEKQTGNPVGVFALKPEEEKDAYSLSAFQHPSSWNRGYNGELLSFFCEYARKQWGVKALTAYVVGENTASRKSLERNGFSLQEKMPVSGLSSGLYRYRLEWGKEKGDVL